MTSLVVPMLIQLVDNGVQQHLQFHGMEMHFMAKAVDQFTWTMLIVQALLIHSSFVAL